MDQRAAVCMDPLSEDKLDIDFSQRRSVVQIPNDLSAEQPQVIYVLPYGLAGKAGGSQIPDEGPEASHQFLTTRHVYFPPHPGAWPILQILTIRGKVH